MGDSYSRGSSTNWEGVGLESGPAHTLQKQLKNWLRQDGCRGVVSAAPPSRAAHVAAARLCPIPVAQVAHDPTTSKWCSCCSNNYSMKGPHARATSLLVAQPRPNKKTIRCYKANDAVIGHNLSELWV